MKPKFFDIDNTNAVFESTSVIYNSPSVQYSSSTNFYGGSDRVVDEPPMFQTIFDIKPIMGGVTPS